MSVKQDMKEFYELSERERIPELEKQYSQELQLGLCAYNGKKLTPGQRLYRRSYLRHAKDVRESKSRASEIRSGKVRPDRYYR